MHIFEDRCKKIRVEQPKVEASTIEEVVKNELIQKFNNITLDIGRKLLKDARIPILPEWDMANNMIFDTIRREEKTKYKTKEEALQAHKGVKFIEDHNALVLWSLQDKNDF